MLTAQASLSDTNLLASSPHPITLPRIIQTFWDQTVVLTSQPTWPTTCRPQEGTSMTRMLR